MKRGIAASLIIVILLTYNVQYVVAQETEPKIDDIDPKYPIGDVIRHWITIKGANFSKDTKIIFKHGKTEYRPIDEFTVDEEGERFKFIDSSTIRVRAGFVAGTWEVWAIKNNVESNHFIFTATTNKKLDSRIIDLINGYVESLYYNDNNDNGLGIDMSSRWKNIDKDMFKIWLTLIAAYEGSFGGYSAHSQGEDGVMSSIM